MLLKELWWEQGDAKDQEVRVFIPIQGKLDARDVELKLQGRQLRVVHKGSGELVSGLLWSDVDDDSYFEIEQVNSRLCLVLYIAKKYLQTWEFLWQPPFRWEQAGRYNEVIQISIPVGSAVQAGDVDFRLSTNKIRIGLKDQEPFLDDELWGAVDIEDSEWMIEELGDERLLQISLAKLHVREHWERLLKTEEGERGLPVFSPGSRKEVDLAVLGQLDYVHSLLQQRDNEYARDYLDHLLPAEESDS